MKVISVAVLMTGSIISLANGQDAPPTFRVDAKLVVIDLVALDSQGRFVADLQPTDIRLREDGKPQTIRFLERVTPTAAVVSAMPVSRGADASATGHAIAVMPERGKAPDAHLAIVLDTLSIPIDAFPRIRDALLAMMRTEVPSDVPVMLATVGSQVVIRQPFTTDPQALAAAIDALPAALAGRVETADLSERIDRLCNASRPAALADAAIEAGKSLIAEANARSRASSLSLSMLARSLAPLPGRKHIVLYSTGYAISPANQAIDAVVAALSACIGLDMMTTRRRVSAELAALDTSEAAEGMRAVIDRANRAQVSFYTVDPRALTTSVVQPQHLGRSATGGSGPAVKLPGLSEAASRDYLQRLALDTGGRTFFDMNDMVSGFRRAWLDAQSYYLIGYVPESSRTKGRFRKVSVTITRPNLDIRYRRGYYEWTERELADRDVENALQVPGAFVREGFDVSTSVEGETLKVAVDVSPRPIRFTDSGGEHQADFSVHGELRDSKGALVGGKPLAGRDIALRVNDDRLAAMRTADKLRVLLEAPVPSPGTYRLTVVARDSGGWIAVRSIQVTVHR